ncbi:hypothetical protein DFQ13_11817 [Actinokineospora spheciospongiae]|nr:hypothetical protein DFQ13_11817 [Actinokineospora spheciospongiae]
MASRKRAATLRPVGTVITPQLVDIVDTATAVRSFSSGTAHGLRVCQVERWGLRMEYTTPDDPFSDTEITWLLPDLNLRLTQQKPRSRHAKGGPSVLTAVRVLRDGRYWRTTDLLLGLAAPGGTTARIVRSEEFAAAVGGQVLRVGDADLAMCTVHKTLEELSRVRHDLSSWLAHKHIFEVWPPY